jgi:hypothetical protein
MTERALVMLYRLRKLLTQLTPRTDLAQFSVVSTSELLQTAPKLKSGLEPKLEYGAV